MLACRPRPHRLATLPLFRPSRGRSTSSSASVTSSEPTTSTSSEPTSSTSRPASQPQDSIFSAPESPWDHVFSDIDPNPPLLPRSPRAQSSNPGPDFSSPSGRKTQGQTFQAEGSGSHSRSGPGIIQRSSRVRQQRASLTAREMSVFDEMFDMIFDAVSAREGKTSKQSAGRMPSSVTHSFSGQTPSIGRSSTPANDIFRTLRRHTSRVRWTTAIDEELDRKKETMELFNTDHDLFQWVMQEVFGESQRWDEEAKKAIAASNANSGTTKEEGKGRERSTGVDSSAATTSLPSPPASSTSSPSVSSSAKEHSVNPSIYPHLIAHAMRIFRTTFSNPSLSLAIFNHAARVSIPSYVFGCTAPAYNELIETKWRGWADLEGICNALEEMRANGVKIDGRTRIVVEKVRREVGEARPAENGLESKSNGAEDVQVHHLARRVWNELGETEVMRLLHRIEKVALRDRSRKTTSSPHEESWKNAALRPGKDDGWSFDEWDKEKKTGNIRMQKRRTKPRSQDEEVPSHTLSDKWTVLGTSEDGAEAAFR